jgi:hypothetical protein
MNDTAPMILGIGLVSILSGMMGIGSAFAAIPLLSLFYTDLTGQVQPLALLLNGCSALFALIGFSQARLVDWRKAFMLSIPATVCAPIGAYLAGLSTDNVIWVAYYAATVVLLYLLYAPVAKHRSRMAFVPVLLATAPISLVAGFIGVGPGFLLVPAMVYFGADIKRAAAINAFAVTPASFAAALPNLDEGGLGLADALPILIVGSLCAYLGAHLATTRLSQRFLKHTFSATIIGVAGYRGLRLLF